LHLFGSLRAFQQPERLRELLLVWRSLDPELGDRVARAVTSAFDAARRVDTRPLIEAGYQGAQLGQQVQQQRLGAIRESLASSRVCYPGEIAG
jgi:tRNA nucleotidyltransferase (CCA-adding enzyme)